MSWLLNVIALRLTPLIILLVTIMALLSWKDHYPTYIDGPVAFKIIEDQQEEDWGVGEAIERLRDSKGAGAVETKLSESWFWVMFEKPDGKDVIIFPSRHLWSIQCWDDRMNELGRADRSGGQGALIPALAGFAILNAPENGVCRVRHMGPAVLWIGAKDKVSLEREQRRFERHSGLLEGGMVMLALIAMTAAVVNRQPIYFLMSIWLVVSLRIATLSFGSDTQWLGFDVPSDWLPNLRAISISVSYLLTWLIAKSLLGSREQGAATRAYMVLDVLAVLLFALSVLLPYRYYLPAMWAVLGIVIPMLGYLIICKLIQRGGNKTVLIWYASALAIWLLATLYEVIAALFGLRAFIGTINHTISALATSILMLVAITIQAKSQRLVLARGITMAQEEQSRLLARELHDSLGNTLSTLRLGVAMMRTENQSDEGKKKLDHMVQLADEAIRTTRSVSHNLHPIMLETLGLPVTLRSRLDCFSKMSGIKGEINFEEAGLPKDYQQAIYRVVQEALSNISKHSGASRVSIRGERQGGRFIVEIQDDGKGGAKYHAAYTGSLGLQSMRERVDALGGSIDISSPVGKGTRITLNLPMRSAKTHGTGASLTYTTEE